MMGPRPRFGRAATICISSKLLKPLIHLGCVEATVDCPSMYDAYASLLYRNLGTLELRRRMKVPLQIDIWERPPSLTSSTLALARHREAARKSFTSGFFDESHSHTDRSLPMPMAMPNSMPTPRPRSVARRVLSGCLGRINVRLLPEAFRYD